MINLSAKPTLALALLLCPGAGYAQIPATNTGPAKNDLISKTTEGEVTNGVRGTITVEWPESRPKLAEVVVEVVELPETNIGPPDFNRDFRAEIFQRLFHDDWWYFGPTNDFCGPIEMLEGSGRKLRLLRPEVSSPDAYPAVYTFDGTNHNYMRRYRVDHAPPGAAYPEPWQQPELVRFRLFDYFEITNGGDYHITVWPKVYIRTSTNTFGCKLIDVPPVTATFKYLPPRP